MKILIRDISRHLYLGQGGNWVKSIADARTFALGSAAIEHVIRNGLTGVDLYCVFRNITFNTAIPVSAYETMPRQPGKQAAEIQSTAQSPAIRVLLVEDDPDDVMMIKSALRTALACEVTVTFTQDTFESELETSRPDLIISDSNVRAFDGFTALKLARKRYPDVPFVFCSGSMSPEKRETAQALGATAWTSKDNSFRELVQITVRLLGN